MATHGAARHEALLLFIDRPNVAGTSRMP